MLFWIQNLCRKPACPCTCYNDPYFVDIHKEDCEDLTYYSRSEDSYILDPEDTRLLCYLAEEFHELDSEEKYFTQRLKNLFRSLPPATESTD